MGFSIKGLHEGKSSATLPDDKELHGMKHNLLLAVKKGLLRCGAAKYRKKRYFEMDDRCFNRADSHLKADYFLLNGILYLAL
jgi:hypothetical protein